MKNSKKFISLALSALLTVSSVAVFADEEVAPEATEETALIATAEDAELDIAPASEEEIATPPFTILTQKIFESVNLGDAIKDSSYWLSSVPEGSIKYEKNKITVTSNSTVYTAYSKDNFANKLISYKQTFDYGSEGKSWGGFVLNANSYSSAVWSGGSGYLVVIKKSQIELQTWNKGRQKIVKVIPNKYLEQGKSANVSCGAFDLGNGVEVVMFVDGECILNYFDQGADAVTEGKYFTLYETSGSTVEPFDGDYPSYIPSSVSLSGFAREGDEFKADYTILKFDEETNTVDVSEQYDLTWYWNAEQQGKLDEFETSVKNDFGKSYYETGVYEKKVGEGMTHEVKADEIGGFYVVTITDKDGNVVSKSAPCEVNNYQFIKDNALVLLVDYENAYVNGKKVQIDPEDYNVTPTIKDSRTLVPVRFIAESYGADVDWDGNTKKITIKLDDKEIIMTLDETKYTVNGEEFTLDVPAQVMNDRTMVPVRVVSEAFGKDVFWDGENYLIIISDEELGLDNEKDAVTLSYLYEQILKRL